LPNELKLFGPRWGGGPHVGGGLEPAGVDRHLQHAPDAQVAGVGLFCCVRLRSGDTRASSAARSTLPPSSASTKARELHLARIHRERQSQVRGRRPDRDDGVCAGPVGELAPRGDPHASKGRGVCRGGDLAEDDGDPLRARRRRGALPPFLRSRVGGPSRRHLSRKIYVWEPPCIRPTRRRLRPASSARRSSRNRRRAHASSSRPPPPASRPWRRPGRSSRRS
jgi:hypothetical protein